MDFSNVIHFLTYGRIKVFRAKHIFTVLLAFRLITLKPPACCCSSNRITVVSLCFRKTGLVKVALSEPRKHCHCTTGEDSVLSRLSPTAAPPRAQSNEVTWKEPLSKQQLLTPTVNHVPSDTLLTAAPGALKLQGAAHATTQNKSFWNITLNEQSVRKKHTETERAACPLTLWATEPASQGFSGKQAEVQSQPSRSPRMWTKKGFITRKKRRQWSNFLLF